MENLFFCAFVVAEPKYVCIFVMLNTTSVCHSRRATVNGSENIRAILLPLAAHSGCCILTIFALRRQSLWCLATGYGSRLFICLLR